MEIWIFTSPDSPEDHPRSREKSSGQQRLPVYWGMLMWRNNGDGPSPTLRKRQAWRARNQALLLSAPITTTIVRSTWCARLALVAQPFLANPREGKFNPTTTLDRTKADSFSVGAAILDFDHDGWMDFAFTHLGPPTLTLWRNNHGKSFDPRLASCRRTGYRAFGVAAFDYDNDGWVDLVAVGETKDGKGEIRLFRNLGPDGFKDVTTEVGLDKIQLKNPRAIITGRLRQRRRHRSCSSRRIMAPRYSSRTKAATRITGCASRSRD